MRTFRAARTSVIAASGAATLLVPSVSAAGSDVRVLLVGSSLVRGIRPYMKKLYKHQRELKAKIKGFGPARWTLSKHAESSRSARIISRPGWDHVFLAQSSTGGMHTWVYPAVTSLHDLAVGAGAQAGLLMTWFGEGVPAQAYDELRGTPGGDFGYVPIARDLGVPIAPAGWAIRNAVTRGTVLGDGTHVNLWRKGTHLSFKGEYLASLIVYATIERRSPVGLWAPETWNPLEVAYLQQLAHDTLVGGADDWQFTLGQ